MKIKYFILLSFVAFATFACKNEIEDVFDKPSNERLTEMETMLKDVLTSSTDGWEVQYVADSTVLGGFDMLMKFSQTNVTVQGDNFFYFPTGQVTSLYDIRQTQVISLIFSTYNGVFTLLADPDPNYGSTYLGQNELLLQRISNNKDTIFFKTRNTNSLCKFIRHSGDWDSFFNKVNTIGNALMGGGGGTYFKQAVLSNGTTVLFAGFDNDSRTLTLILNDGTTVKVDTYGVIVTSTGLIFLQPIIINGAVITGLTFDEAGNTFIINGNSVSGTFSDINEPSFIFPGQNEQDLNKMVFMPKTLYELTGGSPELMENLDSVLYKSYRVLNEWGEWDGFYGFWFYPFLLPNGTTGHALVLAFLTPDSYDFAVEAYLFGTTSGYPSFLVPDNTRSDKLNFKRPTSWSIYGWESGTNTNKLLSQDPQIRTYMQNALNLMSAIGNGAPYIIVPSANYKDFTFASTQRNFYFKMSYLTTFN